MEKIGFELRLAQQQQKLAFIIRARRMSLGWSQEKLAKRMKITQSRVAQIEAAGSVYIEKRVSIDVLLKALHVLGEKFEVNVIGA